MSLPICRAKFRWTPEEWAKASAIVLRHSKQGQPVIRAARIFGPMIALPNFLALLSHYTSFSLVPGSFHSLGNVAGGSEFPLLPLVWMSAGIGATLLPWWLRSLARKQYEKRPERGQWMEWEVFEDHLTTKMAGSFSTIEWQIFLRVVVTADGCLLFNSENTSQWIPIRAFESRKDIDAFVVVARSKASHFEFGK